MRRPLRSDEARSVANLAIDLGDPGRMAKARRIHRGNNVGTVDIGPGIAETTVSDPSGEIYDVTISVTEPTSDGQAPPAEHVESSCTCDDGGDICTHGLAAILGIAEEIEANGRLLAVWAGESRGEAISIDATTLPSADDFLGGNWVKPPVIVPLSTLKLDHEPSLIVDDVDAGPVVVDARGAIRGGLSRYRARP